MKVIAHITKSIFGCALSFEDIPMPKPFYPPQKSKKHNPLTPALHHRNKHRYVSARKLSRK